MTPSMTLKVQLICVLALLSGCSLIPQYQRPAAPVAAAWPAFKTASGAADAALTATAAIAAADVEWQTFFRDPKLKQLIQAALHNNRDLRIAVLNIEQARAQYQIRRADQLPTVSAAFTGSRTPNSTGAGGISNGYTAGLAATSYELDFFGRVSSLKEAALSQYLASEEGRKSAQIALIASVANTYLSLLADEELLALTQQTLNTRVESLRLGKLRFDNGVTSELDYRQFESLLEGARVVYAQTLRQRALDQNLLTLLVGQSLDGELAVVLPAGKGFADVPMMAEVPVGLPSDLLVRRPDVRQAEQQLLAANANIGAARAAFFPRITLTGSAGSVSNHLSGLFKSGSYGWTFAPQLVLPIFDFGRNSAAADSASISRDIAVAQYEKSIQTAFREVADALAGRATWGEQLRAIQAQAQAEVVRYRLAGLWYENGMSSSLDSLDAQRSLFAMQQSVVQTRLAQLQSQIMLYKALGGGWKESAAMAMP